MRGSLNNASYYHERLDAEVGESRSLFSNKFFGTQCQRLVIHASLKGLDIKLTIDIGILDSEHRVAPTRFGCAIASSFPCLIRLRKDRESAVGSPTTI